MTKNFKNNFCTFWDCNIVPSFPPPLSFLQTLPCTPPLVAFKFMALKKLCACVYKSCLLKKKTKSYCVVRPTSCPGTCFVGQNGLKLTHRNLPAFAFWGLGLWDWRCWPPCLLCIWGLYITLATPPPPPHNWWNERWSVSLNPTLFIA